MYFISNSKLFKISIIKFNFYNHIYLCNRLNDFVLLKTIHIFEKLIIRINNG